MYFVEQLLTSCCFEKMDLNHGGADFREEYQEIRSVYHSGRDHSGISAVLFDPLEELVWTGNQSVGIPWALFEDKVFINVLIMTLRV